MNSDFGTFWAEILSEHNEEFKGADAQHVADGRRKEIKGRYLAALDSCDLGGDSFKHAREIARNTVGGLNIQEITNLQAHSDDAYLTSLVAIPKPDLGKLRPTEEMKASEFSRFGICAIIRELTLAVPDFDLIVIIQRNPRFLEYYSRYSQSRAELERRSKNRDTLDDANKLTSEIQEARAKLAADQDEIQNAFKEHVEKITGQIGSCDADIKNTQKTIDNFKNRVTEDLILKEVGMLWKERATASRFAFYAGLVLTLVLLLGTAALIVCFHNDIARYLKDVASGFATASSSATAPVEAAISQIKQLIFISVPLIVILWIARFGMRFTMRSLALYDDAKQRDVMLNTYIFLTGEGKAQEKHRALMLNALFRPLPGQPGLDVEPPNWAELMKVTSGDK